MCRMFAYYGSSWSKVEELFNCLSRSAEVDPYFNNSSHKDGWGFVIVTRDKIIHYRSGRPIFEDTLPIKLNDQEMIAVFHARQASAGNPIGSQFSHPYLEVNQNGSIFLAHNGSVDKERLLKEVSMNSEYVVDSELALKFISRFKDLYEGVEVLKGYTKSALNLFLVNISRLGEAELYYLNYVSPSHWDRVKSGRTNASPNYYDLYINSEDGDAVFSSTLSYYCSELGERKAEYSRLTKLGERMKLVQ
ncbi:class II glutamine amidotransferase [Sulfolobus acidocaldarius]|uniref:Glutamine amidotransferase class-II n=4 Tax=Sulfolobus acidocaldarius TaxID=2285 RepID=Q4J7S8_SULAC|nr:class II glutamine amidotransferase [Sulfolobus acidocaldarius]AAY81153.1 glutamine amidotransferase class-II [Sulfolobus acidocaldarius DSM 639]